MQGCGLLPERQTMLSRKVVTRSGRGFRGYFPSQKLNRHVQFESILERDAIRFFEKSEEVLCYREQPTIIYYYQDDEQRKYYPDFELVLIGDVVVHVEVKPSIHLATIKLSEKYQLIAKTYQRRSEKFVVLTEKELRGSLCADFYQILNNENLNLGKGGNHATVLL